MVSGHIKPLVTQISIYSNTLGWIESIVSFVTQSIKQIVLKHKNYYILELKQKLVLKYSEKELLLGGILELTNEIREYMNCLCSIFFF